jgi:hypothetical protein
MKSAALRNLLAMISMLFVTSARAQDLPTPIPKDTDAGGSLKMHRPDAVKERSSSASTPSPTAPATDSCCRDVPPARLGDLFDIWIEAYGADPTGVRSSCSAWSSALATIPNGGTIHFGRGVYKLPCSLTASNVSLRVAGAGASQSTLRFTAPGGGFVVTQDSHNYFTQFDNLKIQTVGMNQTESAAIWVNYTEGSHQLFNSGVFRDISIDGVGARAHQHYWKYGIHCTGCDAGLAQNVDINGLTASFSGSGWSPSSQMSVGVLIDGGKNAGVGSSLGSNGFVEDHVTVYDSVVGTQFIDDSEGPVIVNGNYVGVNHGVYAPDGTNWPSFFVQNDAFACYTDCVLFAGYQQGQINANYAMKRPESTENFTCYVIADNPGVGTSLGNIISANACSGFKGNSTGGTAIAVSLGAQSERNLVEANSAYNVDYFINENNGRAYHKIADNLLGGFVTPSDAGWCSVTGPAPNISSGLPCKTFRVAQSSATTITTLLNGQVGQIAVLTFADSNSTLRNGANLALNGGVDWIPYRGDTITFIKDSATEWREIARAAAPNARRRLQSSVFGK